MSRTLGERYTIIQLDPKWRVVHDDNLNITLEHSATHIAKKDTEQYKKGDQYESWKIKGFFGLHLEHALLHYLQCVVHATEADSIKTLIRVIIHTKDSINKCVREALGLKALDDLIQARQKIQKEMLAQLPAIEKLESPRKHPQKEKSND